MDTPGEGYDGQGKTGPICCESSFTVEVRLLKSWNEDDSWGYTTVALVASEMGLDEIDDRRLYHPTGPLF